MRASAHLCFLGASVQQESGRSGVCVCVYWTAAIACLIARPARLPLIAPRGPGRVFARCCSGDASRCAASCTSSFSRRYYATRHGRAVATLFPVAQGRPFVGPRGDAKNGVLRDGSLSVCVSLRRWDALRAGHFTVLRALLAEDALEESCFSFLHSEWEGGI